MLLVGVLLLVVGGGLAATLLRSTPAPAIPTARIIDQLGRDFPNPAFVESATGLLQQAGYQVEYVPPEEVTVEFFRQLPAQGDDVILLRSHSSGTSMNEAGEIVNDVLTIATGQPFNDGLYVNELRTERLGAFKPDTGSDMVFMVTPSFLYHDSAGTFDDTLVVLMGCDGLRGPELADTLTMKGAAAVAGWTGAVDISHTDTATEYLLRQLVEEEQPLLDAVLETRTAIGADPQHGAELVLVGGADMTLANRE
jgi:hypothetical protein